MSSNYLNPSILSKGIDSLSEKYIGWLLVGKVPASGDTSEIEALTSNKITSDKCICGIMKPVQATLTAIENEEITFGNIGYWVNSTDDPTAPIVESKSFTENTLTEDNGQTAKIVNIATSSIVSGSTSLFIQGTNSDSKILPSGVTSDNRNSNYIDITESNGKVVLVKYKDTYSNASLETLSQAVASENFINDYIDEILFYYTVNASNVCNDYYYTGFSVGNIEVALSGLTN